MNIHDLFQTVREHPDFVFGTIFVREDFPNGEVPEDFPVRRAEDVIVERGNQYLDDMCGPEA